MKRAAVFGMAVTGKAVAKALVQHGVSVVASDDKLTAEHHEFAKNIGCDLAEVTNADSVASFLHNVDALIPAPGVPPRHSVLQRACDLGIDLRTEIDIAYQWESERTSPRRPILGVTGTDGKTTTTMLVAHILRTAGVNAAEVGNTDVPFMEAQGDEHDVFVVECSSFRLNFTHMFRCDASVWLNIAPDHLDWHETFEQYVEAKSRIWKFATAHDVAVAPIDEPIIISEARKSAARLVTFGVDSGDYYVNNGVLVSPHGELCTVESLWRSLPHDITNSLAAAALVLETGLVTVSDVVQALQTFVSAHHRIELVGEFNGSQWFDDSKATSPHAALTAIRAFDSLVLIAGGKNKDLDLGQMASEPQRMAGVIAIGHDAPAIEKAFSGVCTVVRADSMAQAVREAAQLSRPGVAVVLSPGCTSYDWYKNYNERGDHFVKEVRDYFGVASR